MTIDATGTRTPDPRWPTPMSPTATPMFPDAAALPSMAILATLATIASRIASPGA